MPTYAGDDFGGPDHRCHAQRRPGAAPVGRNPQPALLAEVAALDLGVVWPVFVDGDTFETPYHAPTTGPAPYLVSRIAPTVVSAVGTTEETHQHSARGTASRRRSRLSPEPVAGPLPVATLSWAVLLPPFPRRHLERERKIAA